MEIPELFNSCPLLLPATLNFEQKMKIDIANLVQEEL